MNQLQFAREELSRIDRAIEERSERIRVLHKEVTDLRARSEHLKRFIDLGELLFAGGPEGSIPFFSAEATTSLGPMAQLLAEHAREKPAKPVHAGIRGLGLAAGLAQPPNGGALARVALGIAHQADGLAARKEEQVGIGLARIARDHAAHGLHSVLSDHSATSPTEGVAGRIAQAGLGLPPNRHARTRRQIADAAVEIIRTLGPQPTRELVALLKERGFEVGGSGQQAALSVLLSRDERFESQRGLGGWTLADQQEKGPTGGGTPAGPVEK